MAQDFKLYGVAVISIGPGPTRTERARSLLSKLPNGDEILEAQETPQFSGLAIANLRADSNLMSKCGRVVIAAEGSRVRVYRYEWQAAAYRSATKGISD